MRKVIFIIGGNGFIGRNLIECFIENTDYDIVVLDRKTNHIEKNERISVYEDDASTCDITKILSNHRPNVIINSAATVGVCNVKENPIDCIINNYSITANLLKSIKNIDKYTPVVFFFSSSEVYGSCVDEEHVETISRDNYNSRTAYGHCKLKEEELYVSEGRNGDFIPIIMRLFNIVGRYQSQGFVIPDMVKNCENERIIYAKEAYRSFCSVHFLTHTILHIITSCCYCNIPTRINFGTKRRDNFLSMKELAGLVSKLCGCDDCSIIQDGKDTEVFTRKPFYQRYGINYGIPEMYLEERYDVPVKDIIEDYISHKE